MADAGAPVACTNCGAPLAGEWCTRCGQERIVERGALRRYFERQVPRILHTVRALLLQPGQLTLEYARGQRVRSISAWRLTFNVLALFLALSFVTGFRVATFARVDQSGRLQGAIAAAAVRAGVDEGAFVERVERRFALVYTGMTVVTIAAIAIVVGLTHRRRRWNVAGVFALHVTAWGFLVDAVFQGAMEVTGATPMLATTEVTQAAVRGAWWLLLFEGVMFAYVLLALRRVYGDGVVAGSTKALLVIVVRLVISNLVVFASASLALMTA
ncbi:MAG: DUF3667 domain-containing protein [Proteobacteria bacterium]|nr:DUF3667 domain-containing protein [Pseudomonadota bacterium]